MPATSGLAAKPGRLASLSEATRRLIKQDLLIGVPDTTAEREPTSGEKGTPINNATIGYIQENGDDEHRIPPRPHLVPGVEDAKPVIVAALQAAGSLVLTGDPGAVERGFEKAGHAAVDAVRKRITDVLTPPLSIRTIEARAARTKTKSGTKGAKAYLKLLNQGTPKEVLDDLGPNSLIKPLIDTGKYIASITFVVRDRS